MGVKVRQKAASGTCPSIHQGQRRAQCIGSDQRVAVQVQKQLRPAST